MILKRLLTIVLLFSFLSCEKEIQVDIPEAELKLVVEGSIEPGQPPFILLTKSQGYFDPFNLNTLENLFVRDATIEVSNGQDIVVLDEICSDDVPPELLPLITELTGFTAEQLSTFNLCAYTTFDPVMLGEENKVYTLDIQWGEHSLTSKTKIPPVIALDSVWFETSGSSDSLGFAHGLLSDPDTTGNAYRWLTKRINLYPDWSDNAGEQKDTQYYAPIGSSNNDNFFNGLQFEFIYNRSTIPNSSKEDDINDERGFFKVGDTIAVRGCSIDQGVFNFFYDMETQIANQGSIFAVPFELDSNIEGGLGVWAGYGVFHDTIICQ